MSYSRWSNSEWYSFWNSASGPTKDEQILSLWYSLDMTKDWTYAELKQITIADLTMEYPGVPHDVLKEGWEIVQAFIHDVDNASEEELQESYADFLRTECGVDNVDLTPETEYNPNMKILSEYTNEIDRSAKVYRLDEGTFCVHFFEKEQAVRTTHYDHLQTAEDEAEDFILDK